MSKRATAMPISSLCGEDYDDIFEAVFERFPPASSQELENETRVSPKGDDFDHVVNEEYCIEEEAKKNVTVENGDNDDVTEKKREMHEDEDSKVIAMITEIDGEQQSDDSQEVHRITGEDEKGIEPVNRAQKLQQEKKAPKRKQAVDQIAERNGVKTKKRKRDHVVDQTDKKKKKEVDVEQRGTWVQCMASGCSKWRFLSNVHDPSDLSDYWICSMNPDSDYNYCSASEQEYDESEHIFTKYTEGSIVWARLPGYPWWPAMIDVDPDLGTFYDCTGRNKDVATHYHVVFLDAKVSRSWVNQNSIQNFNVDIPKGKSLGQKFDRLLSDAVMRAQEALDLCLKERLEKFGFIQNYSQRKGLGSVCSQDSSMDEVLSTLELFFSEPDLSQADKNEKKSKKKDKQGKKEEMKMDKKEKKRVSQKIEEETSMEKKKKFKVNKKTPQKSSEDEEEQEPEKNIRKQKTKKVKQEKKDEDTVLEGKIKLTKAVPKEDKKKNKEHVAKEKSVDAEPKSTGKVKPTFSAPKKKANTKTTDGKLEGCDKVKPEPKDTLKDEKHDVDVEFNDEEIDRNDSSNSDKPDGINTTKGVEPDLKGTLSTKVEKRNANVANDIKEKYTDSMDDERDGMNSNPDDTIQPIRNKQDLQASNSQDLFEEDKVVFDSQLIREVADSDADFDFEE